MKKLVLSFVVCFFVAMGATAQQNENVFTYKVGDYEICLLSEGQGMGNSRIFIGATQEMVDKTMPDGTFPNATNAFLIKTPDKTILVDAGFGRELFNNLKSLGVTPEQVDMVLLTHMHGDHIGGMLKDGEKAFPNATVHIATREHSYWMKDDGGAKNVINAYQDKLILFLPENIGEASKPVYPGIYAIAAYGHTPGHVAFLVESKSEKVMIWGDLTHAMAIQMPYPEVAMTYDTNTEDAIKYRKQILKYVSDNKIPVAGMHIAYPGIGNVSTAGAGYVFTPVK